MSLCNYKMLENYFMDTIAASYVRVAVGARGHVCLVFAWRPFPDVTRQGGKGRGGGGGGSSGGCGAH